MRIAVTGGAGFIGSHIADSLVARNHQVLVVDDLRTGSASHVPAAAALAREAVEGPTLSRILAAFAPDTIVHAAAQTSVEKSWADPHADAASNVQGTLNILRFCATHRPTRLVYFSSAAVYGDPACVPLDEAHPLQPTSPYGASKLAGELYSAAYARQHGFAALALRLANVFGPRQRAGTDGGVVATFAARIAASQPLVIQGSGDQTRDFIYVGDVVKAVVSALSAPLSPGLTVVNVATGQETSVTDLAHHVLRLAGQDLPIEGAPARPGDIARSALHPGRIQALFGWEASTPLQEGLRLTLDAARAAV